MSSGASRLLWYPVASHSACQGDHDDLPALHCHDHDCTVETDPAWLAHLSLFRLPPQYNERTNSPCNYLAFPTDVVLLVVLWRVRDTLRLRDLAAMFLERGFAFTHEAVRDGEARFAPLVADKLRAKRKGKGGCSWHVDATYIKVSGAWKYLYRAIDREGNLVDSLLSEHRDMHAAKRFFKGALEIAERAPQRVTTAGHDAYPRAIRENPTNPYSRTWRQIAYERVLPALACEQMF